VYVLDTLPNFGLRSLLMIRLALRTHPVVPSNSRFSIRDTVLPLGGGPEGKDPLFVPRGTMIGYSPYAMHRRHDIYGPVSSHLPLHPATPTNNPPGRRRIQARPLGIPPPRLGIPALQRRSTYLSRPAICADGGELRDYSTCPGVWSDGESGSGGVGGEFDVDVL
jgi:hypothetical protein